MGEAAAREPSMEDILASIRKIISQDDKPEPAAPKRVEPASVGQSREQDKRWYDPKPEATPATNGNPDSQPAEARTETNVAAAATPPRPSSILTQPGTSAKQDSLADLASRIKAASSESGSQKRNTPSFMSEPTGATERPSSGQYPGKPESFAGTVPQRSSVPPAAVSPGQAPASPDAAAAPERAPVQAANASSTEKQEQEFREALVSPSTQSAVHGSIDRLKSSLLDNTDAKVEAVLRPMLREWLDENLPRLVEKIVRDEVERIARGK